MSGTFQGRVAFASIEFPGGTPTIANQSGDFGTPVTDGGVGKFTVPLVSPIDSADACISLSLRGAAGAPYVRSWTDTALTIWIEDFAGGFLDISCDIVIVVKPAN